MELGRSSKHRGRSTAADEPQNSTEAMQALAWTARAIANYAGGDVFGANAKMDEGAPLWLAIHAMLAHCASARMAACPAAGVVAVRPSEAIEQ